jgi:hypothetical protein
LCRNVPLKMAMLTFDLMTSPRRGFLSHMAGAFCPLLLEVKTVRLQGVGLRFCGAVRLSDKFGQTFRVNQRKNGNAEIGIKTLK